MHSKSCKHVALVCLDYQLRLSLATKKDTQHMCKVTCGLLL